MSEDYVHTGHRMDKPRKKQMALQAVVNSAAGAITELFERRIVALEHHINDLEDRLNDRGIFSGPAGCNGTHLCDDDCPDTGGFCPKR